MDKGHDKTVLVPFRVIEGDRNEFWVRCLWSRPAVVNGSRIAVQRQGKASVADQYENDIRSGAVLSALSYHP